MSEAVRKRVELTAIDGGAGGEPPEPPPESEPAPIRWSDDYLAQGLSETVLDDDWVYVNDWKVWLRYENGIWKRENTLEITDLTRRHCRAQGGKVQYDDRLARSIDGEGTIGRVERLTRALRRHAAVPERFDTHPNLLATPEAVIDLRYGVSTRLHDRKLFLTKSTAVAPLPEAGYRERCPRWLQFLSEMTGGDPAIADYLQKLVGCAAAGHASGEHLIVVLTGAVGGEGKSLFLNTISRVLGGYAAVAPADLLIAQTGERHPTELADFVGARLVVASEIDRDKKWAEAKLKMITGGDPIKARRMKENFFTFSPNFMLFIATNHVPRLRSIAGFKRRLQIIPFRHRPKHPDRRLPERLEAEWSAILSWIIEGSTRWRLDGLAPPQAVKEATREYFKQQDPVALWRDERLVVDPMAKVVLTRDLHTDYQTWAGVKGADMLGIGQFRIYLTEAGFTPGRDGEGGRGFRGIRLKAVCDRKDVGIN